MYDQASADRLAEESSLPCPGETALRHILGGQIRRYPQMQPVDLYKLLHQGSLGSEHAVPDEAAVRAWLERELAGLGDGPEEPEIDPISPGGEIVRVHLRPYLAAGGDPERLLEAFVCTAREFVGSKEQLRSWGEAAERMAQEGLLPFAPDELGRLLRDGEELGFPAAHHSRLYQELYRPAYRVVAALFLPPAAAGGTEGGCRPGCGACCIAVSISSPIPGMPEGKPAGVRCVQLTPDGLCALFGRPDRPAVCVRFGASEETCGHNPEEAMALMAELERATRPER